jgi:hypothetical protein
VASQFPCNVYSPVGGRFLTLGCKIMKEKILLEGVPELLKRDSMGTMIASS